MSNLNSQDILKINSQDILKILPHRYPFLLVDKAEVNIKNQIIVATKNVTFNEPHFTGHFQEQPVMPGVLIVEALAQAGGILAATLMKEIEGGHSVLLTGIEDAKFKKMVVPGNVLSLEVSIEKSKKMGSDIMYKFKGKAYVESKLVSEASFGALLKKS